METQIILAVDDNGKFLEYIPRSVGHAGAGRCHLAITVLLFNSRGQVLLQRRKHQIFDNMWDLTGATHLLHKADSQDETVEEAATRCLKTEYGITEQIKLENLGFFNYFTKYGDLCENEHCAMMAGEYNGAVNLDSSAGYEYKWVDKSKFLKDLETNPKNYTPWAASGTNILKQANFF